VLDRRETPVPRVLAAVTVLTAVAFAASPASPSADGPGRHGHHGHHHSGGHAVTYAVIGDTPYGQPQVDNFPNDVAEINADPTVRRVIHLGDIKNGSSECSTAYFEQIRSDFDGFVDPFVYTPGDNEWTDCHRTNNGAYWPAGPVLNGDTRPARLDEIRRIFFDNPGWTLGMNARRVETQGGGYPENVRWRQAKTQFGVVHVVGSNNDWAPWFGQPRTTSQTDEVEGRTAASLDWLDRIFDRAKLTHARAVVLGIQADMWDPFIVGDPASHDHFTSFVQALADRARAFHGPVILFDGDSHIFTDDRPLADPAHPEYKAIYGIEKDVPNLRRITVNGRTTPCHEWLKVRFDPSTKAVISYERVLFSQQPGFDPAVCPEG
jgi:hypothetical protein